MDYGKLLKESISDSSSDEDDDDDSSQSSSSATSDTNTTNVPIPGAASFDGFLGNETPERVDVEDFPSPDSKSDAPARRDAPSVSLQPSDAASAAAPLRAAPEPPDELIPLRKRAYSDLQSVSKQDGLRHQARPSVQQTKETPERWRNRLWPSKALVEYSRMILRCTPPEARAGDGAALDRHRRQQQQLSIGAYWQSSDFTSVGTTFAGSVDHSASFFLLTVEESRVAAVNDIDSAFLDELPESFRREESPSLSSSWIEGEVMCVVSESEFGCVRTKGDSRLGSIWVVKTAIRGAKVAVEETTPGPLGKQPRNFGREAALTGGDLMLLHSTQWMKPLLAIVQPWDPDYDLKFGIKFSSNAHVQQSMLAESLANGDRSNDLATANLLICVDGGDPDGCSSISSLGGWALPGYIKTGSTFQMAPLGNVMTYIRECQALLSLKLLQPRLAAAVLNPEGRHKVSYITDHLPHDAPGPSNVPPRLWEALRHAYNDSQLRALRMISKRDTQEDVPASPICLLQGPPGTGKTKTILGILSILLAGALKPSSKATKVIAGSSFNSSEVKRLRSDSLSVHYEAPSYISSSLYPSSISVSASSASSSSSSSFAPTSSSSGVGGSCSAGFSPGSDRPRILICAPSNTAVDELVFRILTQGILGSDGKRIDDLNVVRIGHVVKDEYLQRNKASHCFSTHPRSQEDGRSALPQPSSSSARRSSNKGQHSFLTEQDNYLLRVVERVSLDNIVEDRRRVLQSVFSTASLVNSGGSGGGAASHSSGPSYKTADIRKQVLEKADIVASTLSGAGSQPILELILRLTGFKFDAVIIDEAAQAVEPSTLIPFKFNPQLVVLVGDPCQLPATVFSRIAKEHNYSQSLFLRLQRSGLPVAMLETQYRMHPWIAEFPSRRYYNRSLLTDAKVAADMADSKAYYHDASGLFRPFVFHDVMYAAERVEHTSIANLEEARHVANLCQQLLKRYPKECQNMGIIAPYRAQRKLLTQILRETLGAELCAQLDPEISTVDGFQGREKDIIIFSCVRASNRNRPSGGGGTGADGSGESAGGGIGFLKEWQRLNVAITRARYALWIVGHQHTLQRDPEWRALLDYARQRQAIVSMRKPRCFWDLFRSDSRAPSPSTSTEIQEERQERDGTGRDDRHHNGRDKVRGAHDANDAEHGHRRSAAGEKDRTRRDRDRHDNRSHRHSHQHHQQR